MRPILILTLFFLAISSCNLADNKQNEDIENSTQAEPFIGQKFFTYDGIDYYSIDFDESEIYALFDNRSRSVFDSFKMELIAGNLPSDITDLASIDHLAKVGYKKTIIDSSKFDRIDEIFVEKTPKESIRLACMVIYRDILIFKKDSKVVGTAKICFDCGAHQIRGAAANTENFGLADEYWDLRALLGR